MTRRSVKQEAEASREGGRRNSTNESEQLRTTKKEKQSKNGTGSARANEPTRANESTRDNPQGTADRRVLRSQYLALFSKISDVRDDLSRVDSNKFVDIINEVENLHQKVQKPREQIADAEVLLDIANTLVSSVKSQTTHGVSPADFINSLINGFGQPSRGIDVEENALVSINWKDIGRAVCSTIRVSFGCSTMLGPMDNELKQKKKAVVNRKRTSLAEGVRPDEVDNTQAEEKTDTDKNMLIMFNILRRNKRVRVENLVLNRRSFAQTVENLFALSFLVKDGRVEITVDQSGSHFVLPRNAPAANSVMSGEVVYNHFVFRFDYKDWKLMTSMVSVGEELMPHRETATPSSTCQLELTEPAEISQEDPQTTPIRKLSRNRGLVIQEETVIEDSPDIDCNASQGAGLRRRCKRRIK